MAAGKLITGTGGDLDVFFVLVSGYLVRFLSSRFDVTRELCCAIGSSVIRSNQFKHQHGWNLLHDIYTASTASQSTVQ